MGNMLMTPEALLLVKRAQEGDTEAFAVLVKQFECEIRRYLAARLGDYDEANDLTQQVFFKAWLNFESLHEVVCFKLWLFRIAKHLASDYWRRKKVACQSWEELALDGRIAAVPGPEEGAEKADLIQRALIRLSFKLRQCLLLHAEGYSAREIARIVDISTQSAGTYVSMARRRFRAIYQELEDEARVKEPVCV